MAPARKVSAAPTSTDILFAFRKSENFPMNVVFPAPFTPTTSTTVGPDSARTNRGSLLPERSEVSIPFSSAWRNCS